MRLAPLAGVAVLLLALPPGAAAQSDPPCPTGTPSPLFTVNGRAQPVYTTHDLLVRVRMPGGADYTVRSFEVAGVRRRPHPDGDEGATDEIHATGDSPGMLTATATIVTYDATDSPCTVTGSAAFEVRAATRPAVSRLRRPPVFKRDPRLGWDSRFYFRVSPGATGARTPLTVEARAILRARVPGPGVAAATRTFAMRPTDIDAFPEPRARRGCSDAALICPPKVSSWPRGADVSVDERPGRAVPAGLRIAVTLPRGYPRGRRLGRTPVGVDVKVLQEGELVARLRIAGRCDPVGQFSRCRYRRLTTAL